MFFKDTPAQGQYLFARDTTTTPPIGKTGLTDISSVISKDGGGLVASVNSVVEVGVGLYWLPFDQAESNANALAVAASSATIGVVIDIIAGSTNGGAIHLVVHGGEGGLPTSAQVTAVRTGLALSTEVAANTTHLTEIKGAGFGPTFALDQTVGMAALVDAHYDEALSGHTTAATAGKALEDRYFCQHLFIGGVAEDLYDTVRWFRNDSRVTSGVTLPKIQVIVGSTGLDLIAETAMSEAGSSHLFRYAASGAGLTTDGLAYSVVYSATIDGAVRTWEIPFKATK